MVPDTMRRFLSALILLGASAGLRAGEVPRPASADEVALLQDAIRNNQQDTEHWAYTETTQIVASKGSPTGDTVVRFDPSKPYAEQYTPLRVEGRPPGSCGNTVSAAKNGARSWPGTPPRPATGRPPSRRR